MIRYFTRAALLLILALFAHTAQGQTASFTADAVSGCAPLVVHFTDGSTPGALSYYWDFGDGYHSVLSSPSTSYTTPGTYTVTLTVTYPGGIVVTHTMTITVYPPPTVSFSASDTVVCPGIPITFTSTSLLGVPGAATYLWSFGDGATGSGSTFVHAYTAPGFYTVTLSVTNAMGCTATLVKYLYIHVVTGPTATISAPTTFFCSTPATATFGSSVTGTAPFTYTWTFGDGGTGTGPSPSHTYLSPGTYTVTLAVTDASGCNTTSNTITITVATMTGGFIPVDTVCQGTSVTFVDTSAAHTSQHWDFGDGTSSSTDPGIHTYAGTGSFTVSLTIYNGPCSLTITHTIYVVAPPVASFVVTPPHPCPAPATLTFTATAPPGSSITWAFGDGGTGSGATTTHTYGANRIYTIVMTVTDPATGCIARITRNDTIDDLFLLITAVPTSGCKPLTVRFSGAAMTHAPYTGGTFPYPFGVSSYSWTFGDGGSGSGPTPSHTYTATGTYFAVLTVTTANGCTATDSIRILVGSPPVVTFSATPTRECYHNNLITFTATVISGPVDSFRWSFGDGSGGVTTFPVITHHYIVPGVFTITLIGYYNGCPSLPVTLTNYITIDSPKAIAYDTVLCTPAGRVKFFDSSMGDDVHTWLFGDGTTSTLKNPIHDYAVLSTYTVTLATLNTATGCRDTTTLRVDLRRPTVDFTASATDVCTGSMVTITSSITGGLASSYSWSSWGGTYPDSVSSVYYVTFPSTGIYTIRLVIADQNHCLDTVTRPAYIRVAGPVASFSATPTSGCWPLTVTFTDLSTDVAFATITSHAWVFGDGGSATTSLISTVHTFTSAGTFSTVETVTDNFGCSASVTLPLVTVYRPHAAFTPSSTFPCSGVPVTFSNTSTGAVSYYWTFGDGSTSALASPTHAYSGPGSYSVMLAVTDSHGCNDTAYFSPIVVTRPTASFNMSDSQSICPPLLVYFIATGSGAIAYNWSFGDGTFSTSPSPSDLYIIPGYDTVRLIVTDIHGCADTAYAHVNIFGYAGGFSFTPDSGCVPLNVHFTAFVTNVSSITWDFADGNVSPASLLDTTSHTYILPGAYVPKLIVSDNTGCQNSSTAIDTIKVDAVTPDFTVGTACINSPVMFKDGSKSYWSVVNQWSWTFISPDGSTLQDPSYSYSASGTYPVTLSATDAWGCTASVVKNVIIHPLPVITASPDTVICLTDQATLTGYGGVSYTWAPPISLSCTACNPAMASPPSVTTYTVTGKDEYGCFNSDSVTVIIKTRTESRAWGDTAVCFGIPVPLHDSGGNKYTWLPALGLNNANIANPVATPHSSTVYMAIAKLGSCVPDTNYVRVVVYALPTVDAGPDQDVLEGSTAQLQGTGTLISTYQWSPASTLSCDKCSDPVASMTMTTTYGVVVTSANGCRASDTVTIRIYCDKSQLFIPNAFTPNGDGQNDIFYPRGTGISIIKTFRIYNRWGECLFERNGIQINDASNAWDGSYKGALPRPDVYVYIIDAICETGAPINVKGDVTIIR